jgi:hypothetical protein
MDGTVWSSRLDRSRAIEGLCQSIVASVNLARAVEMPFYHLQFERVFPDVVYASMLGNMPIAADYRPMHGRSRGHDLADGTHTRVKIDLFPEYIRRLPPEKRAVWELVGRALCSDSVKTAFARRLAPELQRRFGNRYLKIGMYPVPVLTRDISGYWITPHTDTRWKAITVQFYLPRDNSMTQVGTIFHEKLTDGTLAKRVQMKFSPNTGYAFVVGDNTWHSVDPVGAEVTTRDSILQTYFVDGGLRYPRNRGKRFGNFLLNEVRALKRIWIWL